VATTSIVRQTCIAERQELNNVDVEGYLQHGGSRRPYSAHQERGDMQFQGTER
jgi:hypothetical protein